MTLERIARSLEDIDRRLRNLERPAVASFAWIARHYGPISVRTVKRRCKRYGIPIRDVHGDLDEAGGCISVAEWEAKEKKNTRSIKSMIRRR